MTNDAHPMFSCFYFVFKYKKYKHMYRLYLYWTFISICGCKSYIYFEYCSILVHILWKMDEFQMEWPYPDFSK